MVMGNPGRKSRKSRMPRASRKSRKPTLVKVAKQVKQLVKNQEYKTNDVSLVGSSATNLCAFQLLNGIDVGDAYNNRDGNKYVIKSIQISPIEVLTGDSYNTLRMVVFIDRSNQGSAPGASDLFQVAADPLFSFFNSTNRKRFKVLYDRVVSADTTDNVQRIYPGYYKKLNLPVECNGSGSSYTAINKNSVWVMLVSDSSAAPHPLYSFRVRMRFVG